MARPPSLRSSAYRLAQQSRGLSRHDVWCLDSDWRHIQEYIADLNSKAPAPLPRPPDLVLPAPTLAQTNTPIQPAPYRYATTIEAMRAQYTLPQWQWARDRKDDEDEADAWMLSKTPEQQETLYRSAVANGSNHVPRIKEPRGSAAPPVPTAPAEDTGFLAPDDSWALPPQPPGAVDADQPLTPDQCRWLMEEEQNYYEAIVGEHDGNVQAWYDAQRAVFQAHIRQHLGMWPARLQSPNRVTRDRLWPFALRHAPIIAAMLGAMVRSTMPRAPAPPRASPEEIP